MYYVVKMMYFFSKYLPNRSNFNSRLASRLSLRSWRSISWLIRFCSFNSSVRQHAILTTRCSRSPVNSCRSVLPSGDAVQNHYCPPFRPPIPLNKRRGHGPSFTLSYSERIVQNSQIQLRLWSYTVNIRVW